MTERVAHQELTGLVTAILAGRGVPESDARTVAELTVDADLCGRPSHGVARLPAFLAKLDQGGIDPRAVPEKLRDRGATFVIDGHDGFGQLAVCAAVRAALRRSERYGVAWGAIRNTNNPGMLLSYGRMAAQAGQIAVIACNAAPAMPPYGGAEPFLGTNPICLAIPGSAGPYPILDMATTASSKGAIRAAERSGTPLPPGWALAPDGSPTTDPVLALKGMLQPAGGAKGAGLSLMVDLLAGLVSGGAAGPEVRGLNTAEPSRIGGFVITLVPDAFTDREAIDQRLTGYLAALRAVRPARGVAEVLLPGERAWRTRQQHLAEGVPVPPEVLARLERLRGER